MPLWCGQWPCITSSNSKLSQLVLSVGIVFLFTIFCCPANARTFNVNPGENLQAAINAAQFGDRIILQAGGVYYTPANFQPYNLTNKGPGSGYITITSSVPAPADGTRVTLADRANMPKLVVRNGSAFFEALRGAHHYRLSNLWVTNLEGGTTTQLLSTNGYDITHPDPRDPLVDWPHDLIIDHCFFNPVEWDMYPEANLCSSVNTAVGMAGINVTIRDSVMKGFGAKYGRGVGANLPTCGTEVLDGEAVIPGTAPGPMLIDNNYMEAWFVAFFIGGGDPGSIYGGTVLSNPASTLTSATLSNVNGLRVGDKIAFELNVAAPSGHITGAGTITSINGNSVTFTHLVSKWLIDNQSYIPIPDGAARPKTVDDPGGVAPCSTNYLGVPSWCSRAYWGGYNPSNITITHNYINKPTRWYNYTGTDGKGFFEIKLCDTCLIDGNIFDGNTGWTVTVRNQGGRAPWSAIRNLTISNNLVTRFSAGFAGLFKDNEQLSEESTNINITNNLMYGDTGPHPVYGVGPYLFSSTFGDGVSITHNTVLQSGDIMHSGNGAEDSSPIRNFVFKDNIVNWGVYPRGYRCFSGAMNTCTPNMVWTKNAMIGAPTGPLYAEQSLADFPAGNWNPVLAGVGFTDPASGNYRLLPSSPYYRAASDGKDVGVDMDQLLAHLNGPIPVPTPTPTPTPNPNPTPTPSPTPTPTPTPNPGGIQVQGYVYANGTYYTGGDALVTISLNGVVQRQQYGRAGDGLFAFDGVEPNSVLTASLSGYQFDSFLITQQQPYWVLHGTQGGPTPTPTPTPDPGSFVVSITHPISNSVFLYGDTINVRASASNTLGNVTRVNFLANGQIIGTSYAPPYNINWSNMLPGAYQLVAKAEDDCGNIVSSTTVEVRISKTLKGVKSGKDSVGEINNSKTGGTNRLAAVQPSDMIALVAELEQTYSDFLSERSMFLADAPAIGRSLYAALVLAKSSAGLLIEQTPVSAVNDRLRKLRSYLSFCEDLMQNGVISETTITEANSVNARVNLSVGRAEASPEGSLGFDLLPNGTARIRSTSRDPFSTQTANSAGAFELADVSVTINDRSAVLLSVSPTELVVVVPASTQGGIASVVVTSREGFVHFDAASVAGLNPRIFGPSGDTNGRGVAVDALSVIPGNIVVDLPLVIGLDGRRRIYLLATGLSTGLTDSDRSNDVWLANGRVLENFAEAVAVEARTSDGRVFFLPVEYAGSQGELHGIDQISIVLTPDVAAARNVQLTIIAGGLRSNTMTVLTN